MNTLVFITERRDPKPFIDALKQLAPEIKCAVHPDVSHKEEVIAAVAWNHPHGVWEEYPNLRWVSSLGAGIDHLADDPTLPANLLVSRIVDDMLKRDMSRYVTAAVLNIKKRIFEYAEWQKNAQWKPLPELSLEQVGILGAGELGADVAQKLAILGFDVATYSQTKKEISGVRSYFGEEQLSVFLKRTEILVNLLPLNQKTKGILNAELFGQLPKGTALINVARGGHLVEADLLSALDNSRLSFSVLDVFQEEPLPEAHPLWKRKDVFLTPHIASVTQAERAAKVLAENYTRLLKNKELLYQANL